uniref:Ribonuclease A-domain domain-containing protein n=1 Tax=Phasianus colchicus TaxID=9054 RepID=A0A669QC42_PHACC
ETRVYVRKHVDFPRTPSANDNQYCNLMMQRRRMASRGNCKTINTFVHTAPGNLIPVCTNQPDRALRTTGQRFPVTVCKLISSKPNCTYRGNRYNHRVQVGCLGGRPVHLTHATSLTYK